MLRNWEIEIIFLRRGRVGPIRENTWEIDENPMREMMKRNRENEECRVG